MSFAEEALARTSRLEMRHGENGLGLMGNEADYSLNGFELLTSFDPITQSWRTSQRCLDLSFQEFSGPWPRSGMMLNGEVFVRQRSVPFRTATGSGLLPTLTAQEGRDWSKASILARLDKGGRVARRLCSRLIPLCQDIVGLNPSFAEWMAGYQVGWTELKAAEIPLTLRSLK